MSKQDSILHTKTDSVLHSVQPLQSTNSIFSGHSLKTIHSTPMLKISEPTYWQGIVLFVIFIFAILIDNNKYLFHFYFL